MPSLFYAGQPDYIEKLNTLATAASMTNGTVAASFLSLAVTGTATAASFVGPLTGNASTATTLATARNINGVAFNGSADITVTAAAGTLTGTTLAANVVNASLNSITPSGGTLSIGGSAIVSNRLETQGFQGAFFGNAGGVYTTWGTASPVGDIGTGNVIIGGGSASDFALNVRGANILHLCSGDVSRVAVNASGAAVAGSISATTNLTLGNGTGIPLAAINGAASGANGGASLVVQTAGNSLIGLGNKSALLGGAYDATPMLYGNAPIEVNQALNVTGSISATGNITSAGNVIQVGAAGTGTGGNFRITDDGGTLRWLAGLLGTAGARDWTLLEVVSGRTPIRANASTGAVSIDHGLSVTGLTTTDTLRVNVTPTAETPTATHTAVFNINGTNYKFLCLVA